MKTISVVRRGIVAGSLAAAGLCVSTPAFAAPAQVLHQNGSIPAGYPFNIGSSPTGVGSCQFPNNDANFVFQSGNMVMHETGNANGDWGGMTLEGPAVFLEDNTAIGQGHLTIWEGGGNNSTVRGQNEGGFTVDFTGTVSGETVQIHVNGHMTVPANSSTGVPTAQILNVEVSCS